MKKKTFVTIVICLMSTILLVGCKATTDTDPKDKPENVKEEAEQEEIKGEETGKNTEPDTKQAEKDLKEMSDSLQEDVSITDVSWNFGSYEEFSKGNSDVNEVYFTLSNGETITKQIPLGYYVDKKEELDIDGDGEDEIVINQCFSNTIGEYNVVYIYKLVDGEIKEIFPTQDIPELMDDVADTLLVNFDKEGYPKYALDVTILKKDGGEVSLKYHALLAWHNGAWEKIEYGSEADDDGPAGDLSEQEPFFGLWVNAYKDRTDAESLVSELKDKGLPASYVYSCDWENLNKEPYFCVTIGRSGSEPEAQGYLEDARKAGYPKAYVKYTGERLGHRFYYYLYSEGDNVEVTNDKVILHEVSCESVSDEDDEGPMDLVIDADTVFDESCDTSFFDGYQKGDTPIEWIHHARELEDKEPDHGPALLGVYEVSLTGMHVDRYYGSYWWD